MNDIKLKYTVVDRYVYVDRIHIFEHATSNGLWGSIYDDV